MADIIPWPGSRPARPCRLRPTAAYLSDFLLRDGARGLRRQHQAVLGAASASEREMIFYIDSGLAEAAQIGTAMKRLLVDAEDGKVGRLLVERVARLAPSLSGALWALNRLLQYDVEVVEAISGRVTLDNHVRQALEHWSP